VKLSHFILNFLVVAMSPLALVGPSLAQAEKKDGEAELAALRKEASALVKERKLSKARPIALKVVSLEQFLHGQSPVLVGDLSRVIAVSCASDRCFDALPELRHILELKSKLYGENYPGKPFTLQMIGEAYEKKNDYESAEKYYREAIESQIKARKNDRDTVDLALNMNLVRLYEKQNRLAEAEALYRRLLYQEKQRGLKASSALVQSTLSGYRQLLSKQGRQAEARALKPDLPAPVGAVSPLSPRH
jgi:tetratricopeptide (TPR) repeat protein